VLIYRKGFFQLQLLLFYSAIFCNRQRSRAIFLDAAYCKTGHKVRNKRCAIIISGNRGFIKLICSYGNVPAALPLQIKFDNSICSRAYILPFISTVLSHVRVKEKRLIVMKISRKGKKRDRWHLLRQRVVIVGCNSLKHINCMFFV
jgi:hypothetical protein